MFFVSSKHFNKCNLKKHLLTFLSCLFLFNPAYHTQSTTYLVIHIFGPTPGSISGTASAGKNIF